MSAPKPPLAEALAELHAIVDGDDIDTGSPDDDLRAQVAALTAERDRLRALVREQVSCECSNDDACRFVRERDEARAERDRLARVLACERGDEGAAPDGWRQHGIHWRKQGWKVTAVRFGHDLRWVGYLDGVEAVRAMFARDAMLAADEAARAGESHADKPDTPAPTR